MSDKRPSLSLLAAIGDEVVRARTKFPGNKHLLAALTEEVGELAQACSLGNYDSHKELSVTCKVSETEYKKHFLGLSDNVSYFVEQLEPSAVNVYHYRVIFRPELILPDIDLETSQSGEE